MSRMTISEALSQEDIVALESGVFRLLPFVDCSGRQIIVIEISRDTRYGYSFENLVSSVAVALLINVAFDTWKFSHVIVCSLDTCHVVHHGGGSTKQHEH